jgi:hypothetical protein
VSARPHSLLAGAAVSVIGMTASCIAAAQVGTTGLRGGMPDKGVMAYVGRCLGVAAPRPIELYARGGWYVADDLRKQLHEREGNIEGIAMVWKSKNLPRAVYQWSHDGEFNRNLVACIDTTGKITRSESQYTPGDSEPDQRWVYIHTLTTAGHHGSFQGAGRFTDRQGHPRGRPYLTSEDEDFIAGERLYQAWTDFDFAGLVGKQGS